MPEACYQPFAGAETVQYEKLADPPYNIALSNSYIGNVWRTQMIKMAKAYAETPDIAPLISEFQVNTADRDDAAQQAAIENMISNGAQAIVILANTPTALVQTVQQARADGIVIVSFDTTVHTDPPDPSLDLGVTVNEDQVEMGRRWAQWLVDQTGGEGKILMVNGVQGTGVDQERRQGAAEVWDANPGIEIVEVSATGIRARRRPSPRPRWRPTRTSPASGARAAPTASCAPSSTLACRWCRWRARPRTASASRC